MNMPNVPFRHARQRSFDPRQIDALVRLELPAADDAATDFRPLGRYDAQLDQPVIDQDPIICLHNLGQFGIVDRDFRGVSG
ncbi:hypothetical protein D3C81_1223770 [compost metagenome]